MMTSARSHLCEVCTIIQVMAERLALDARNSARRGSGLGTPNQWRALEPNSALCLPSHSVPALACISNVNGTDT